MNTLILALLLFQAAPPKPPTIPDALQAKFWKAQATMQFDSAAAERAAQKLNQSRAAFQAALKELQAACGKDFEPQMNPSGDPVCVAKQKPAVPAKK